MGLAISFILLFFLFFRGLQMLPDGFVDDAVTDARLQEVDLGGVNIYIQQPALWAPYFYTFSCEEFFAYISFSRISCKYYILFFFSECSIRTICFIYFHGSSIELRTKTWVLRRFPKKKPKAFNPLVPASLPHSRQPKKSKKRWRETSGPI